MLSLWWPEGMSPTLVRVGWEGWIQPSLEAMSVGTIRRTDPGVDWAGRLTVGEPVLLRNAIETSSLL